MNTRLVIQSLGYCLLPIIVYLCVKLGTVAFYKAKQFIIKEEQQKKGNAYEQKKER